MASTSTELNPLQSIRDSFIVTSKDMAATKFDAWIYGIVVGWDDDSYKELAKKYGWSPDEITLNKTLSKNYNFLLKKHQ